MTEETMLCDKKGNLLLVGDVVRDEDNDLIGFIERDKKGELRFTYVAGERETLSIYFGKDFAERVLFVCHKKDKYKHIKVV